MCKGVYRDITGQKFGKLTVLGRSETDKEKVVCKCDCGAIKEVRKDALMSGKTKTCGAKGCRTRRRNEPLEPKYEQHTIAEYIAPALQDDTQEKNMIVKSFENDERVLDINKLYKKMYKISKEPRKSKKNSSGYVGVSWNKKSRRWMSGIGFRGQYINLGSYKIFDDAVKARKEAEDMLFAPAILTAKEFKNAIEVC